MEKKTRQKYSESFKQEKVEQLESGEVRLIDLKKMYGVSYTALYKWKKKYGRMPASDCVVLEKESEYKKNQELRERLAKMERLLGKQQVEIDYYKELIIAANTALSMDIEKKFVCK